MSRHLPTAHRIPTGGTIEVSDWHINAHYSTFRRDLHNIVARVEQVEPEAIVINGDMLDNGPPRIKEGDHTRVIEALAKIQEAAPDAKIYINYGNHEKTTDFDKRLRIAAKQYPNWVMPDPKGYHVVDKTLYVHGDSITDGIENDPSPRLCRRDLMKQEVLAKSRGVFVNGKDFAMATLKTLTPFLSEFYSLRRYDREQYVKDTFAAIAKDAPELLEDGKITDVVLGHIHPGEALLNIKHEHNGKEYNVSVSAGSIRGTRPSILHIPDSSKVPDGEKRQAQDLNQKGLGR